MRRRAISEPRAAGEAAPYVSGRPHQERPMRGIRADTRAGETESLSRRIAEPASPTPGGPPGAPCILRCGGTKARGWLFRVTVNAAYRRSSPSPTPLPDDREIDGEWDQWRNSPNPRSAPLPHTPTPHPPSPKNPPGNPPPQSPFWPESAHHRQTPQWGEAQCGGWDRRPIRRIRPKLPSGPKYSASPPPISRTRIASPTPLPPHRWPKRSDVLLR